MLYIAFAFKFLYKWPFELGVHSPRIRVRFGSVYIAFVFMFSIESILFAKKYILFQLQFMQIYKCQFKIYANYKMPIYETKK